METRNIQLDAAAPLPCAVRGCGKPATVAHAWLDSETERPFATPGVWLVQPICRDCVEAVAELAKNLIVPGRRVGVG